MSENFVIVSTAEQAKVRYKLKTVEFAIPIPRPSILSGGDKAWVLTSKSPDTLQTMKFGYTNQYAKQRNDLLNLRTDQVEREEDEQEYDRLSRILGKLQFAEEMNRFRCVVLIDAFLVPSPDNTTYLIHMQNQERPFAIAGIYSNWLNFDTGLYETGFTIITAAANPMLKRIGVEHMPVILTQQNVSIWLDLNVDRRKLYSLVHTFPDDLMNGYPVSGKIFTGNLSNKMLQPIGEKLNKDQKAIKPTDKH
jgi:putative SOS response-associated peptidase YedK